MTKSYQEEEYMKMLSTAHRHVEELTKWKGDATVQIAFLEEAAENQKRSLICYQDKRAEQEELVRTLRTRIIELHHQYKVSDEEHLALASNYDEAIIQRDKHATCLRLEREKSEASEVRVEELRNMIKILASQSPK